MVKRCTAFEEMNKAFDKLNIKPVIDTVYAMEDALQAYEHLGRGGTWKNCN